MKIEATWEAKPKSGITFIDLKDLNVSEKSWNKLDESEKKKLINEYLSENDGILPKVTEFEEN